MYIKGMSMNFSRLVLMILPRSQFSQLVSTLTSLIIKFDVSRFSFSNIKHDECVAVYTDHRKCICNSLIVDVLYCQIAIGHNNQSSPIRLVERNLCALKIEF